MDGFFVQEDAVSVLAVIAQALAMICGYKNRGVGIDLLLLEGC